MQKYNLPIVLLVFVVLFLFPASSKTHASFFGDVVDNIKRFFVPEPKKEHTFTVDSNIALAPGGDVDRDNQIDAGDIIRFTYTLTNKTDQDYTFATLKTNINRKELNFIHNVTGTASLSDDGKTITIPNFRILANNISTITFDARVSYFTDKDALIATEADFLGKDKKTVARSIKKEVKATRINKEKIPGAKKAQKKNNTAQQ